MWDSVVLKQYHFTVNWKTTVRFMKKNSNVKFFLKNKKRKTKHWHSVKATKAKLWNSKIKLLTGVWYQNKQQKLIYQDGFSDLNYHTHGDFWEGLKIPFNSYPGLWKNNPVQYGNHSRVPRAIMSGLLLRVWEASTGKPATLHWLRLYSGQALRCW